MANHQKTGLGNPQNDSLPSPLELSLIAAALVKDSNFKVEDQAAKAMTLWEACAAEIESTRERRKKEAHEQHPSVKRRRMLRGPLKIGNHLLPKVEETDFAPSDKQTDFEKFEKLAIGLESPEKRRIWLKAFLKSEIRNRELRRESDDFKGTGKDLKLPKHSEVADWLELWRKHGVSDAMAWLEHFRAWRLTMENAKKVKKPIPYNLEDAFRSEEEKEKSLERKNSRKSRKVPNEVREVGKLGRQSPQKPPQSPSD